MALSASSGDERFAEVDETTTALLRFPGARTGWPVRLAPFERRRRPEPSQEIRRPPVERPGLVHAEAPSRE